MSRKAAFFLFPLALLLANDAVMARAKRVPATTLVVTTTADSGPGSLRQALADANNGDAIQFGPALNGQTIFLTSGELAIDKNITITGPGPNLLAVARPSGGNPIRIFHVMPGHTVIIEGLTIRDGGGILNGAANLSIINCIIRSNHLASGGLSAIYNDGSGASATLTILDSTVTGNDAAVGGGIYNDGLNATLSLQNSSVDNNIAIYVIFPHSHAGYGGGIYNEEGHVTITNSSVSNNMAAYSDGVNAAGGGIYNTGILTIINSTIHSNQCPAGGGIANLATLTITGSTVSGNVANGIDDFFPPIGDGGGILNSGMLTISNSTISSNTAHYSGGGISGGGSISNSTISDNAAGQLNGGGIFVTGPLEIGNTILKRGTSGTNIVNGGGTVTSHGYNLSSDNGGGFLTGPGDQINADPMLGPLQDNGGPTFTHELLVGSPAINAGDPTFTPPPDFDQRGSGFPRVFNGRIDIGSFELQTIAPTPSPTPTATASPTATITPSPTPCLSVITQSSSQAITTGNSVSCHTIGDTENSYWRAFNVGTSFGGSYIVDSVSFGVESVYNSQLVTVRLYRNTGGAFPGGTRTLIGTTTISVWVGQNGTVVTTPISTALPSGTSELVMELFTPDGQTVGSQFFVGSNASPESGPSYLSAAACGITTPTTTAALGFPDMHVVFSVQGFCEGTPPPPPSPTATATTTATPTATATVTATGTPTPTVSPSATPTPSAEQALNLSTRMRVQTGDNAGIGGFIITGSEPKRVILRGIGPSLTVTGALADPMMELHGPAGFTTIINDNWRDTQEAEIIATGLAPANNLESAIVVTLNPGPYTAILSGKNNTSGVALVEVYDLSQAAASKLSNISTRAVVSADIVIAGFILGHGTMADNVIVRGIGPSLAGAGVPFVLANPTLELRDSNGALIRADNDWQDDPAQAAIISGAGLAPTNNFESAIAATLPPGPYTALLAGVNILAGVGLVEVYDLGTP